MRSSRALAIVAVLLAAAFSSGSAQPAPGPFTLEQILSSPFPSELVAARGGTRLAWVFAARGRRNIFVAEGPEFKARQLTKFDRDDGQEITDLAFTSDGRRLIFVRGGGPNQWGEIPNPTSDPGGATQAIYAALWDDGSTKRLAVGSDPVVSPSGDQVVFTHQSALWVVSTAEGSEPHQLFHARGESASPVFAPDGRRLAFVSQRGTHSFIGLYDLERETLGYLAPSVDRDAMPRWSPDGRRLAFIRQPARGNQPRQRLEETPDPWSIMVIEASEGASAREVWRSEADLDSSLPRTAGESLLQWAADDRLVFASEQDGWLHLYSIPAQGGRPHLLTPGPCEFEQMTLTPDRREIVFSSNCGDTDRRHLWRVAVTAGMPQALTSGAGIEWQPVITGDGTQLAHFASTAQSPAMPFIRPLSGGRARPLAPSMLPSDFPTDRLIAPQPAVFKAADGVTVHGQLFLPPSASGARLPAVIFVHGGPMRQMMLGWHNRYYYHNAYAFNQYLASRGYAVLSVNYRAGIGYGRAFREAKKRGARGASEYQDVLAGAHYLRARTEIDPARIGIWGGSYGGYLTALGLARNSDLFAAGVDIHGVHDWSQRTSASPALEGAGAEAVRIAREASPISAVETWRSPVLLIHGDDDRNVQFMQTVDLVRRLRERKVPMEVIVYPDEVHDFLLHRHWITVYAAAADFFERHLKNKQQQVSQLDLLIRGGLLVDGTGADPRAADVGIRGDRIVFVGDAKASGLGAARVIDAAGLVVAPGFIDPHTHTAEDLSSAPRNRNENYLLQGVTTVVTGNDGAGPFPVGAALVQWERGGLGTNAALFVGQGTVRRMVMGMSDTAPTPSQLEEMKTLVRQAMEEGALGLSTGLYYAPGSFARTEEVIELARVAAAAGGIYDTHMRDESSYTIGLLGSIEETIRIGREARLPVHISHLKALGADVWGQSGRAIEMIRRARDAGVEVTANQYPYTASGTSVTAALVPRWAEAGGRDALLQRLDDQGLRARLDAEMEKNLRRRGGPDSILITSAPDRALVGRRLSQVATAWRKTPLEAAREIIKAGGAGIASFNMDERDIENFMRQPWVMTGSDGSTGHPRKYGTYPRKLREYVYQRRVISLPFMIRASSALVAETLRLDARGRVAEGYFADLIVFDERTIGDRATYEQPELTAVGMRYVIVNGRLAVDEGRATGALNGRALRRAARTPAPMMK